MTSKVTLAIALATVGVAGLTLGKTCLASGHSFVDMQYAVRNGQRDMERKSSNFRIDANGTNSLKVDLEFAEVNIVADTAGEVHGEIVKEAGRPVDDEGRRWLDNNWLLVKRDGDTISVYEDASQKPKLHDNKKENRRLNVRVTIHVPRNLDANVQLAAGDVKLDGDFRSLKAHVDAGQIETNHFASDQSLELKLDAGEVKANLDRVPSRNSDIEVNAGEIGLNVKGDATLDASVGIGTIDVGGESKGKEKGMGSHKEIRVGSGGTKFRLKVDIGSINVAQGKTERSVTTKGEDDESDLNFDFGKDFEKAFSKGFGKDFGKDFDIHMDQDFDQDIEADVEKALKSVDQDVKKALEEARLELEKAHRDLDSGARIDIDDKDLSPEIRSIVKNALGVAKDALSIANKEVQKALKKHLKDHKSESI